MFIQLTMILLNNGENVADITGILAVKLQQQAAVRTTRVNIE